MSREQAVQWYHHRLGDLRLIEDAYRYIGEQMGQGDDQTVLASRALHRFAAHLVKGDADITLQRFLADLGSGTASVREHAQAQLDDFMRAEPRSNTRHLGDAVATLVNTPGDEIDALLEDGTWSVADVDKIYLSPLLPQQDKALLGRPGLTNSDRRELRQFGLALLHAGHGGLTEWLQMCNDGRGEQARGLMVQYVRETQVTRLPHALNRLQGSDGMASERRVGVKQWGRLFVGEHRDPLPVPAPRPAQAPPALPGAGADADDYQLRFLYEHEARKQPGSRRMTQVRGLALSKLAAFLRGANAQDGLRAFLSRQQSDVESIRLQAAAEFADFVNQAPAAGKARSNRRGQTNAALATLGAIPAQERHLPADAIAQLRPDDQLKLLSPQDQALLQRFRTAPWQVNPHYVLEMRAALVRFAVALVQRGEAGLAGWLAMYHDGRHAQGKGLMEEMAGEAGMSHLAEATRRLQKLDNVDPANSIRHARRLAPKDVFPPGFPEPEAALISAAIESMQVQGDDEDEAAGSAVADSTAAVRRRELIGLSNWLRRPPAQGASRYPGGLADLLALERGGEREAIERLRDEYLSQLGGTHGTMKVRRSALKQSLIALLRQAGPAPAGAGAAAAQPVGGAAANALLPGIEGAGDLDSLSLLSLPSSMFFSLLDSLPGTPGDTEVQSRLRSQASQPPHRATPASSDLDSLWLSSLMLLPSPDSLPATPGEAEVQSLLRIDAPQTPEPTSAQSETDSAAMFERYLAEMSDAVESRAPQAPAAPPIDGLLRAMSMLQTARQHVAPMHVGNAASAVGLQAEQLSTFITDDGRLRDTQQVRDWLFELTAEQRDAVLKFGTA
jgi:hypothetical protein